MNRSLRKTEPQGPLPWMQQPSLAANDVHRNGHSMHMGILEEKELAIH
jgi:hypothetical protein